MTPQKPRRASSKILKLGLLDLYQFYKEETANSKDRLKRFTFEAVLLYMLVMVGKAIIRRRVHFQMKYGIGDWGIYPSKRAGRVKRTTHPSLKFNEEYSHLVTPRMEYRLTGSTIKNVNLFYKVTAFRDRKAREVGGRGLAQYIQDCEAAGITFKPTLIKHASRVDHDSVFI